MIDERLGEAIVKTHAKLLILDPIQAYLGGGMDMNRANEARDMTKKLGALAEKYKCAIILIGYMNKSAGNKATYRGMGSIDFFAVARSVLLVGRVEGEPNIRAVVQIKNNLVQFGHPKAFELSENGFKWLGDYEITADEVLGGIVPKANKLEQSFQMVGATERIMEIAKEKDIPQELLEMLLNSTSILKYKENCRMIECEAATTIEYGFQANGHEGYYIMSFEERFLYEKLYYFTGKQRGVLYEIDYTKENSKIEFSNKLFKNKKVELELRDEISKYWGKHTLLSIFNKEREDKNEEYIKESYLEYVFDIIDMLKNITIHCKKTSSSGGAINAGKPTNVMRDLKDGKIKKEKEGLLDRSERIIRDFFTQAYADIKDVYYERKVENDVILYKLYVRKMIGGKIRTIPFSRESAGTQHIIDIIRSLLGAFCGVTVVYDEIDDGIHDLLLKNVLESMIEDITGQLIITTHNTYMLETIDIKSVYLINVDYQGNKEAKCLDKYPRIQGTNNPRIMYLKGLFGGVPIVDILDYDTILQELDDLSDVEGGE